MSERDVLKVLAPHKELVLETYEQFYEIFVPMYAAEYGKFTVTRTKNFEYDKLQIIDAIEKVEQAYNDEVNEIKARREFIKSMQSKTPSKESNEVTNSGLMSIFKPKIEEPLNDINEKNKDRFSELDFTGE